MNAIVQQLFLIMGVWPLVYTALLIPSGKSANGVPAWPFITLSYAVGEAQAGRGAGCACPSSPCAAVPSEGTVGAHGVACGCSVGRIQRQAGLLAVACARVCIPHLVPLPLSLQRPGAFGLLPFMALWQPPRDPPQACVVLCCAAVPHLCCAVPHLAVDAVRALQPCSLCKPAISHCAGRGCLPASQEGLCWWWRPDAAPCFHITCTAPPTASPLVFFCLLCTLPCRCRPARRTLKAWAT